MTAVERWMDRVMTLRPTMRDRERIARWFVALMLLPAWLAVKVWRLTTWRTRSSENDR